MKIAFNLDYDHLEYTGIGRYGLELMNAWIRTGMDCELWMLRNTKGSPPDISGAEERIRYYPYPKRVTDHFWPSLKALISGTSWVHSANGILLPGGLFFRQVTMVHDLGPFLFGHMKADADTIPWRARLTDVARRADCIVVNSKSTMEDLLNVFPKVEDRTFITPLGIDHFSSTHPAGSPEHILAVGTVEPRKNIDGLTRAYALLCGRREMPPLVVAGSDGYRADEVRQLPRELGIADRVIFTGYVTNVELADLYRKAFCLVHPAHHEGFGFTVSEAFTWGLPVVASDTAGLAEYFSEATWMVDPDDIESIANGIEKAIENGVTRDQVRKREEISRELTWENCARKTCEALESLSGRACRRF